MSTDAPGRPIGWWIVSLIDALHDADPTAHARLQRVVDGRRARIVLDGGTVDVQFRAGRLEVETTGTVEVDGIGSTDRETVLRLLDGSLEVVDALLEGVLRVRGSTEDVARILLAVEILLDAAPRVPELQELARAWRAGGLPTPTSTTPRRQVETERELLGRLGVLPDAVD